MIAAAKDVLTTSYENLLFFPRIVADILGSERRLRTDIVKPLRPLKLIFLANLAVGRHTPETF